MIPCPRGRQSRGKAGNECTLMLYLWFQKKHVYLSNNINNSKIHVQFLFHFSHASIQHKTQKNQTSSRSSGSSKVVRLSGLLSPLGASSLAKSSNVAASPDEANKLNPAPCSSTLCCFPALLYLHEEYTFVGRETRKKYQQYSTFLTFTPHLIPPHPMIRPPNPSSTSYINPANPTHATPRQHSPNLTQSPPLHLGSTLHGTLGYSCTAVYKRTPTLDLLVSAKEDCRASYDITCTPASYIIHHRSNFCQTKYNSTPPRELSSILLYNMYNSRMV